MYSLKPGSSSEVVHVTGYFSGKRLSCEVENHFGNDFGLFALFKCFEPFLIFIKLLKTRNVHEVHVSRPLASLLG